MPVELAPPEQRILPLRTRLIPQGPGLWTLEAARRVLVVDDDPDVRAILSRVLTDLTARIPLEVDTATSEEEALALMEDGEYVLLLSDLLLPSGDGLALARAARVRAPRMPRAILTAYPHDPRLPEALADGTVAAVIPKPCDLRALQRQVEALARPA